MPHLDENDILDVLQRAGLDFRFEKCGHRARVRICPICGGKDDMSVVVRRYNGTPAGVWTCHKCGNRGHIAKLLEICGLSSTPKRATETPDLAPRLEEREDEDIPTIPADKIISMHLALKESRAAQEFLIKRGIKPSTARTFRIGVKVSKSGREAIAIPHFLYDPSVYRIRRNKTINVTYRSLPPDEKRYWQEPNCEKKLFPYWAVAGDRIILTTGTFDAIVLHQLGFQTTCTLPHGDRSIDDDQLHTLLTANEVIIIPDNDPSGVVTAKDLARRLGPDICKIARLPSGVKDVNDALLSGLKPSDFARIIESAQPAGSPTTFSASSLADMLSDSGCRSHVEVPKTPWRTVNKAIGNIETPCVTGLLAHAGTGKSTFTINWLWYLACKLRMPTLYWCAEMPMKRFAQVLASHVLGIEKKEITSEHIDTFVRKTTGVPFYVSTWGDEEIDSIGWQIDYAVRRYGVKVIAIDSLSYLVRGGDRLFERVGQISRTIRELADSLDLMFIVIMHPRQEADRSRPPHPSDARYGSHLYADSDLFITMWRKPADYGKRKHFDPYEEAARMVTENSSLMDARTIVSVGKNRFGPESQAVLFYDGQKSTFYDMEVDSLGRWVISD